MNRAAIAVVAMLASISGVRAEDLPRFDIKAHCVAKASERGGQSSCQRAEEAKRQAITARWNSFPKQRKHFCVQSVTFRNKTDRSYNDLAACLEDATSTS
jgi:hypothetical protein